ncbi:alpha/beta hydrolase [Xanthomonas campestris pv. phormiicola]|nr:alpha/beta hydrolase [Xanthomonas campestris pv. phormiicola]UYC17550.1 alpha/beta hydrolase [Xanthomonas campestris pv. phormiicola]
MNRVVATALLLAFLSGCASYGQQRTQRAICREASSLSSGCKAAEFIVLDGDGAAPAPALAFVEFDQNGAPYDPASIDDVIGKIAATAAQPPQRLLLVVFIHGWNHNAAQNDGNVIAFKAFLRQLQAQEQVLAVGKRRAVVGVYLGWQAKASDNSLLELLSYRDKKELGLTTGVEGVRGVLARLAELRRAAPESRLVLIGHSFGGGVLFTAVKDRIVAAVGDPQAPRQKAYGDLVILLNPAIEAEQFVALHQAVAQTAFRACEPLAMASFTSDADTALSREFPRGMRLFYPQRLAAASADEAELITTPYGLYPPFSRYRLRVLPGATVETALTPAAFTAAARTWSGFRAGTGAFALGGIELASSATQAPQPWVPLLNVRVDKALIQEHNAIWDPRFAYFIRGLVGMEFAKGDACR